MRNTSNSHEIMEVNIIVYSCRNIYIIVAYKAAFYIFVIICFYTAASIFSTGCTSGFCTRKCVR
jgi:hypothetical protein